jgi:hypothetical protein
VDKLQLKREENDVKFSYLNNGCVVDGETFLPLLLNEKKKKNKDKDALQ